MTLNESLCKGSHRLQVLCDERPFENNRNWGLEFNQCRLHHVMQVCGSVISHLSFTFRFPPCYCPFNLFSIRLGADLWDIFSDSHPDL